MKTTPVRELPKIPQDALLVDFDGRKMKTLSTFYRRIAVELEFPEYFGNNLDALWDCITALPGFKSEQIYLVVRHLPSFLASEPREKKEAVLDILQNACKPSNRYDKIRFHFFATP